MKKLHYIIIGVVIALIAIILFLFLFQKKREINEYVYPETLIVNNYTNHDDIDIYAKIILNKIFMYDTMYVAIYDNPLKFSTENLIIAAFIRKITFMPHTYIIYVKKGSLPTSTKEILSHELIHLHQMEIGDLIQLKDKSKILYKGDTIVFKNIPYNDRPFEIDAISKQDKIKKQLNKFLYSK